MNNIVKFSGTMQKYCREVSFKWSKVIRLHFDFGVTGLKSVERVSPTSTLTKVGESEEKRGHPISRPVLLSSHRLFQEGNRLQDYNPEYKFISAKQVT